ncbi:PEP-CTERM/exosortase system-associated acyltransferase [Gammaproteobacteria bacterium 53_120_T64]|nr:PEP-CTERM/exosortase system-associated acyltransferase [Gammaproteobacteria bacterium 53_120_T64]
MNDEKASLAEKFLQYFQVELATSVEDKQAAFEVRYRVYCDEFRYEPAGRFPDKAEFDEYDERSLHCLIRHRSSGVAAGCVRLVPAAENVEGLLPFEKYCTESIDRAFVQNLKAERSAMAEVSRLAVDGAFRRRSGESATRFGKVGTLDCSEAEQRTFSLIAIAALLACAALANLSGRRDVFAMMEPFLPRLVKSSGILWQQAGKTIEYHGERALYYIKTQSVIDQMVPELKELYGVIYQELSKTYSQQLLNIS